MKKNLVLMISIMMAALLMIGCKTATPKTIEATPVTSPDVVIAEAHFVPEQNLYLSFLAQGRVAEILVTKGDQITKGQVLAILSDSEPAVANLTAAKLELASAEQSLNILLRTSDLATAQAQLNLATAQDAYNKAVWNRKDIDTPQVTDQNKIDAINASIIIAQDKVEKAQKEYDKFSESEDSDPLKAGALNNLAQAKMNLRNAQNNLIYNYLDPSNQDVLISVGKVEVAKAQLADAQSEYDRLKNGPDAEKLAVAQARVDNAAAQVAAAQYAVDNYEIKAPFTGIVADINIAESEQITPNSWAIAVINPSSWYVDTNDLTEFDIVNINIGDSVTVTVDALPELELTGTVEEISLAPKTSAGDILYTVRILVHDPDPRI
ncbi:MAG: HlyD family efflux transporter periplasmic adaptor subunit, partial [Anaerolineaceae bacterium]|nr:HlyD family efflux transporter periplasmic adaptor subunit [Anaerolineaceae bacterium]